MLFCGDIEAHGLQGHAILEELESCGPSAGLTQQLQVCPGVLQRGGFCPQCGSRLHDCEQQRGSEGPSGPAALARHPGPALVPYGPPWSRALPAVTAQRTHRQRHRPGVPGPDLRRTRAPVSETAPRSWSPPSLAPLLLRPRPSSSSPHSNRRDTARAVILPRWPLRGARPRYCLRRGRGR